MIVLVIRGQVADHHSELGDFLLTFSFLQAISFFTFLHWHGRCHPPSNHILLLLLGLVRKSTIFFVCLFVWIVNRDREGCDCCSCTNLFNNCDQQQTTNYYCLQQKLSNYSFYASADPIPFHSLYLDSISWLIALVSDEEAGPSIKSIHPSTFYRTFL